MTELLFGTAGVPRSSMSASTVSGIERIAELGLGCMELEFVQRAQMSEATALEVRKTANKLGIKLTAHAPYYINFNSREMEKVRASQARLIKTAHIAVSCGVESVIFHPAFYHNDPPDQVYDIVKKYLLEVLDVLKDENIRLWIRPEIMGKVSQFGMLEEILKLSEELNGVAPGIDFAHMHARNGVINSYEEFITVLEKVKESQGDNAIKNMHIHVSGIEYGHRGEIRHLTLENSDFQYVQLLQALADFGAGGVLICESPNLEEDALLLQENFNRLLKRI